MVRTKKWLLFFAIVLIFLSVGIYFFHYLIFHDPHHIAIFMVGDIAFVPIEVLLVTLIIHRLLERRQKNSMMKNMNMVIGTFFSKTGTRLLRKMKEFLLKEGDIFKILLISSKWKKKDYAAARKKLLDFDFQLDAFKKNPQELKDFLLSQQEFILNLLSNPNLMEHEQFSEVMWAIVHLTDEFLHRASLEGLPDSDKNHLSVDMKRAYSRLILQWLDYMEHLQKHYPYLFSLSVRMNPFNPDASPVVL